MVPYPSGWSAKSVIDLTIAYGKASRVVWPAYEGQTSPSISTTNEPVTASAFCLTKLAETVQMMTFSTFPFFGTN